MSSYCQLAFSSPANEADIMHSSGIAHLKVQVIFTRDQTYFLIATVTERITKALSWCQKTRIYSLLPVSLWAIHLISQCFNSLLINGDNNASYLTGISGGYINWGPVPQTQEIHRIKSSPMFRHSSSSFQLVHITFSKLLLKDLSDFWSSLSFCIHMYSHTTAPCCTPEQHQVEDRVLLLADSGHLV